MLIDLKHCARQDRDGRRVAEADLRSALGEISMNAGLGRTSVPVQDVRHCTVCLVHCVCSANNDDLSLGLKTENQDCVTTST